MYVTYIKCTSGWKNLLFEIELCTLNKLTDKWTFSKDKSCRLYYYLTDTICIPQTFFQPGFSIQSWYFDMFQIWPNQECMPKIRVLRTCEHAQFLQGSVNIKFMFWVILVLFIIEFSIFIWTCSQALRTLIFGMHS